MRKRPFISGATHFLIDQEEDTWTPLLLPGLLLWLRAGDIGLTDGASIPTWNDRSSNANHASQATGSKQPTYKVNILNGQAVARFANASAQWMTLTSNISTIRTVFIVGKAATDVVNAPLLGHPTLFNFARSSSTLLSSNASGFLKLGPGYTNGASYFSPTTLPISVGAFKIWTFVTKGGSVNAQYITNDRDAAGRTWDGDYAEIIIAGQLSISDIWAAHRYLAARYGLTAVDPRRVQIMADGDSIAAGQGATAFTTLMATPLDAAHAAAYDTVTNVATGAVTLATMITTAPTNIDTLYDSTYFNMNAVHVFGGTNDMYFGATPAATYASAKTYWAARRSKGFRALAYTVLPRSNVGTPAGFEADRQAYNTLVRSDASLYDALVDVGNDANIGQAGDSDDLTYYQSDKVHPNNAGQTIIANLSATALLSL